MIEDGEDFLSDTLAYGYGTFWLADESSSDDHLHGRKGSIEQIGATGDGSEFIETLKIGDIYAFIALTKVAETAKLLENPVKRS